MRLAPTLAVAILAALPLPATAQDTGRTGVPTNPFASNYPSSPPPGARSERRPYRAVREKARTPALLPPGRIPR